jgi:hypothetical protein
VEACLFQISITLCASSALRCEKSHIVWFVGSKKPNNSVRWFIASHLFRWYSVLVHINRNRSDWFSQPVDQLQPWYFEVGHGCFCFSPARHWRRLSILPEAEDSPPSQCRGQECWSYTSSPPYIFIPWCLVTHKHNFTFYLTPTFIYAGIIQFGTFIRTWNTPYYKTIL